MSETRIGFRRWFWPAAMLATALGVLLWLWNNHQVSNHEFHSESNAKDDSFLAEIQLENPGELIVDSRMHDDPENRVAVLLPTPAAAFASFCVWLTVRIVNRRKRWAKRITLWILVAVLVGYPLSWGQRIPRYGDGTTMDQPQNGS